jgi:hypothetical protein
MIFRDYIILVGHVFLYDAGSTAVINGNARGFVYRIGSFTNPYIGAIDYKEFSLNKTKES